MKSKYNSQPDIAAMARSIMEILRAKRNPARAQAVQKYFKEAIIALGIDSPTMRECIGEQVRILKPALTMDRALELCDRLVGETEFEIRAAGILVLDAFHNEFTPDLLPWAKRWLDARFDNWALVDSFCSSVMSPLFEKHPAIEQTLRAWSGDKSLWVRRASVVTLVPFARKGKLLDLSYELAQEHFPDPEDLMHKATGWLLREAGKKDMARLRSFVLRHGPSIPRTALRYAIERFPAPERAELLEATRRRADAKASQR
jgi:3-methyladenine DNA glycosylase AlkD